MERESDKNKDRRMVQEGSERRNLQSGVALGSKEVVALKAETLG